MGIILGKCCILFNTDYYSYPGYKSYMVSQLHNSTTLEIMNSTYVNYKSEYYGSAVCFKELAELLSAL